MELNKGQITEDHRRLRVSENFITEVAKSHMIKRMLTLRTTV